VPSGSVTKPVASLAVFELLETSRSLRFASLADFELLQG